MEKIGIFGATFNPPTLGHKDAIDQALAYFDKVLLVPNVSHAFAKNLIAFTHRITMLRLFLQNWPDHKKLEVSELELQLAANKPSGAPIYTYEVLSAFSDDFKAKNMDVAIHFIIGPDNASPEVWQKFYRYQEIEAKWPIFVVKRNLNIHSALVRDMLVSNTNTPRNKLERKLLKFLDQWVAKYILDNHLYFR